MRERVKPYLITYFVWFILLVVFILNSKTESGVPYPVAEGLFVSALCAVVFSLPVWIVQWGFLKKKNSKEFRAEKTTAAKIDRESNFDRFRKEVELDQAQILHEREILISRIQKRKIEKCKNLLLDTYVTPMQEAQRERSAALQEKQRKREEEQLERERAVAELRKKQKEIAQEAIDRNQQAQREQEAQKDTYRNQRAEVVRGMSRVELLQDAIRFASTQFYITVEEMKLEYPTLSQKERIQLLSDMAKMGAVQSRPGSDSWLSLVDQEKAKQLIENISEKADGKATPNPSMDQMDGQTFEHFCADLLRNSGFTSVEVTQASGDFGIDILAQKDGVTYGIQCKCYSDTVGNHAVQEALSGAQYYHRMVAVVMTNNYFTQAAVETAKRTNVLLWDRDKVLEMAQVPTQ